MNRVAVLFLLEMALVGTASASGLFAETLPLSGTTGERVGKRPRVCGRHWSADGIRCTFDTSSFASYDNRGNLFVSGYGYHGSGPFGVVELKRGSDEFKSISFAPSGLFGGYEAKPVRWDGRHIAIATALSVVRYDIVRSNAIAKGETSFDDLHALADAWIQGNKIIVVNTGGEGSLPPVQIDRYPAGGAPLETIGDFSRQPSGVTVSLAPRR
jgi:hypothetical protein